MDNKDDLKKILGDDCFFEVKEKERSIFKIGNDDAKAFLVLNKKTTEVRTDERLGKLLREKYETVMESRYFGRGGIEIINAGKQLEKSEIDDLIRLSYNLTKVL